MWRDLSANADKDVEMSEVTAVPSDAKKTVQKVTGMNLFSKGGI